MDKDYFSKHWTTLGICSHLAAFSILFHFDTPPEHFSLLNICLYMLITLIVVIVSRVYACIKIHQIVYIKDAKSSMYQL